MSKLPLPSPHQRETAVAAVAPFLMIGAANDTAAARAIAAQMIEDYAPQTPKELQLAAQIVAFGFAALACLGGAAAMGSVDLEVMLDLQDSAIKLSTLEDKSTRALEARRKERERTPHLMTAANIDWDNGAFQTAIARAREKMLYAQTMLPTVSIAAAPAPAPEPKADKMLIFSAEPMTMAVLARRGAEAEGKLGRRAGARSRQ